jgi:RNA-directed DNA polymerase
MMYGREKSDLGIVAVKSANKFAQANAELMEPRPGAKENASQSNKHRAQNRERLSQRLDRVRERAKSHKTERFTSLLHYITPEVLALAFSWLKRDAASGIDGMTWKAYETNQEEKLAELHQRLHRGGYRALPSKRKYIPKADGKMRPLGIAALEDKIVQRAVVEVLNAIYETDFLGFSYGFRPGRGQHDALDALAVGIDKRNVNWILDADVSKFFDTVDHDWLMKFVEHRINDPRVLRLIQKWLKAGVMDAGEYQETQEGTPQGAVISPLLANVYLHYVFDLWAHQWRGRHAIGKVTLVRYADDIVVGFQYQKDAERFLAQMRERLQNFGLELHPEKTRLIAFGRYANAYRRQQGERKAETFNFLGFTHISSVDRHGYFQLQRHTRRDRMRATLHRVKQTLRKRWHWTIPEQGKWLGQVVRGYFGYHAVPTNSRRLDAFRHFVVDLWRRALRRRSQKDKTTWQRVERLAADWIPMPRILHPWPSARFLVNHPRQEPGA